MSHEIDTKEIIELAMENWIAPNWDGIVTWNYRKQRIEGFSWTGNTTLHPDYPGYILYRIEGNILSNTCWEINDFLDDDEWEQLQKKYGDDADFMNSGQLGAIGIDFQKRLTEYFLFEQPFTISIEEKGKNE